MAKKVKAVVQTGGMQLDWIAIGAAALVYMVLGFFWYSPKMFFPEWSKQMVVLSSGKMEWYTMLSMPVVAILYSIGLSRMVVSMHFKGFLKGMLAGVIVAVFYLIMANSGKWLFANKPSLFWIDFGFQAVAGILMGGVLGKLHK